MFLCLDRKDTSSKRLCAETLFCNRNRTTTDVQLSGHAQEGDGGRGERMDLLKWE